VTTGESAGVAPGASAVNVTVPPRGGLIVAKPPNTVVRVGTTSVSFTTPPQLKGVWQTYVDANAPKEFASNTDLLKYVKSAASTLLANVAAQKQFVGFSDLVRFFERNQVAVARAAVVVGGQGVSELEVSGNSIEGFMQGVVVGVSHREVAPPKVPADRVGTVVIRDNRIGVVIDPVLGRAAGRYAIYIGNVDSLQIENNRATLTQAAATSFSNVGIHVFGYLGNKAIVRHNHLTGFAMGIRVSQVSAPSKYDTVPSPGATAFLGALRVGPLWLVADNVVERVEIPIYAPSCLVIDNVRD
jgi:hypothetical protein